MKKKPKECSQDLLKVPLHKPEPPLHPILFLSFPSHKEFGQFLSFSAPKVFLYTLLRPDKVINFQNSYDLSIQGDLPEKEGQLTFPLHQ